MTTITELATISTDVIAPTLALATATVGKSARFKFANGYGASVIADGYGKDAGLYELAVLDSSGALTHETPITDNVLGWLSVEEVVETLHRIAAL